MKMASRARVLAFHCITWGLIAVVSLLVVEVLLRMTGRVTVESIATATEDVFDRIPGIFQPGQRVVEQPRPQLRHRVSINSLGYRGPEIEAGGRGGRVRLMCIGDSFTYGSYVDDDQTLPAQLERLLRAAGYAVDVVNAGVGGTTIVDQLYLLRKNSHLDIDIVLLVFSENDVSDLANAEPMFATLEKNRRLKGRPGIRQVYEFARHTALFNFALEVRGWYRAARWQTGRGEGSDGMSVDRAEALWRRYDALFGEMQAYLAARDIRFVFAIFPSHYRIDSRSTGDDRLQRVEGLAKARGARTINLLEPLRRAGHGASGLYLLPYDGHPSARGYAVAATAIAGELDADVREFSSGTRPRVLSHRSPPRLE